MLKTKVPLYVALLSMGLVNASCLEGQTTLEIPVQIRVVDPAGQPVPGATVRISGERLGNEVISHTNAAGTSKLNIAPGVYLAGAEAAKLTLPTPIKFQVTHRPVVLNIQLQLGSLQTTVSVEAVNAPSLADHSIDAASLARKPERGLAEKLKSIPGLQTVRRGATNVDPVVTGLRQTQVAMTVDGMRTFAAGPARMDSEISHVDPANVKNVTVVEGPYALTKGAGALSSIQVETDPVPFYNKWTFGGKASSGYSFNGTHRYARTSLFAADQRFGFLVYGTGSKANNYVAGERGGIRQSIPARFGDYQGGGKVRLGITDNQELDFSGEYDDQTGIDYPGNLLNASFLITRSWDGDYYVKRPTPLIDLLHFQLYLNKKGHRMNNDGKPTAMDMPGRIPPFALSISVPTISDTWGGAVRADFHLAPQLRFSSGLDFYNLRQNASRFISRRSNGRVLFRDTIWPDATVADQGYYFSATNQWERGTVAATLRLDTVQARARTPSAFFLSNSTGPLYTSEVYPSFSALANYRLFEGTTISAGFGRAVRTGSVLERYSDRFPSTLFQTAAEFLGDPAIRPEVSYQGNVGLQVQLSRLALNGGLFYRRLENFITVAPDPSVPKELPLSPNGVFRYLNGNYADFRGFNYSARVPILPSLELRTQGAYTLADEISASIPAIGVDQPVFGIPPLNLRHSLRYSPWNERLWVEFSVRNALAQRRVSYTRFEQPTPGFTTYDVEGSFSVQSNLTIFAGVENIFDKFYYEHLNSFNPFTGQPVSEPGRNVFVGLTYNF